MDREKHTRLSLLPGPYVMINILLILAIFTVGAFFGTGISKLAEVIFNIQSSVQILIGAISSGLVTFSLSLLVTKHLKISILVNGINLPNVLQGVYGWFVYFLISIATALLLRLIPGFDPNQSQELGFDVLNRSEMILGYIGIVILPAIVEELLFRGVLFIRLRKQLGFWNSAFTTSLLFGLLHGQVNVVIDTFVLSMVACWLVEKRKSILPSMILHLIKNTIAFSALFIF